MSQIIKRFIGDNQVGTVQVELENNEWLKARNFADNADLNLFKANADDLIQLGLSLLPDTTGTRDLGSGALKFRNLNLSAALNMIGSGPNFYMEDTGGGYIQVFAQPVAIVYNGNIAVGSVLEGGQGGMAITNYDGGALDIFTNDIGAGSGQIFLATANSGASNSGDISVKTGTSSATRGKIKLINGSEGSVGHVWTSTNADGSGEWTAPAAVAIWARESFTLAPADITAGSVALANAPISASVIMVAGGLVSMLGTDYTLTGVTLDFSSHTPALIAGDIITVQYQY